MSGVGGVTVIIMQVSVQIGLANWPTGTKLGKITPLDYVTPHYNIMILRMQSKSGWLNIQVGHHETFFQEGSLKRFIVFDDILLWDLCQALLC